MVEIPPEHGRWCVLAGRPCQDIAALPQEIG
jgi:hypothetical protein